MNAVLDFCRNIEAVAAKVEPARPAIAERVHRYDSPEQERKARAVLDKYAPLLQKLAK